MAEYQWGKRSFGVPAQEVGDAVEKLSAAHGGVCPPSALVEEARPTRSPLHRLFTWDDTRAAEAWRRHEARKVVGALVLRVADREGPAAPAFVHVRTVTPDEVREGYRATVDVVDEGDADRAFVLAEALRMLHGLRRRYEAVETLRPVWHALDEVDSVSSAAPKAGEARQG